MFDKFTNIPIYKKAEDIYKMIEGLGAALPEDDDYIQSTKDIMRGDIMIITAKIVGAEAGNEYTIRMQNAAIIRDHAMNLYVTVGGLRMHENFKDHDYVKIIRKEIDEFRELFIEWKNSFDVSNHFWDEWELFNPPNAIKPEKVEFDDHFDIDDFNAFMESFDFDEDDSDDFDDDFDEEDEK
jgi:hypothetical protein